jgi:uncharacterized protein YceH (UPF0502 family)
MPSLLLTPLEARVLGVLIEKERTVPDTYPMSVNALAAGCNQKTSRAPLMSVTDAEVVAALDTLRERSLVVETSGGRVMRYAHNAGRVLGVPAQSLALLATLILRGPQTSAELRANSERLHRFADVSAVEGFLHELAERDSGALVAELPRAPGTRETRWMQLLSGTPAASAIGVSDPHDFATPSTNHDIATITTRLESMQADLDALRAELTEIKARLDRASSD